MASLLERRLLIVTGKGGTGKTTVACALGLAGAARGSRTIVAELGGQQRLPALFAPSAELPQIGEETRLDEKLWSVSIDPDEALIEWLRALTGRVSARMLASSSTFRYFAAAAPGAKELITMVKLLDLVERYELVVLDASATGHAVAMLRSPQTFVAIAHVGPLANQARRVRRLLEDRERCALVAVAHASEMAVSETLELEEQLRRSLDRELDAVFVNGMLPRRFSREELTRLERLDSKPAGGGDPHSGRTSGRSGGTSGRSGRTSGRPGRTSDRSGGTSGRTSDGTAGRALGGTAGTAETAEDAVVRAAAQMARAISQRAGVQQSQLARLRRQRFAGGAAPGVLTIPFAFAEVDLEWIRQTAIGLARRL